MADESDLTLTSPDDYERHYMSADRALLRVRPGQPRWVPATALAVMLMAMVVSWPSLSFMWDRRDVPGIALILGMMVAWFAVNNIALLFALLTDHITRIALTPSHLLVHRGLWTDEIALSDITAVEAEAAEWWRPKHTLKGALLRRERSYLTPGVKRALRVEWKDTKGRARKVWVQFDAAPAFASRIASLRGGSVTGVTGVRVEDDQRPEVEAVTLVSPTRTGRVVDDLSGVLDRVEVRLRLAWKYRAVLDPALPQQPPFHAHAWTAFEVLRPSGQKAAVSTASKRLLVSLQSDLTTLRNVVAFTTRPDDPAREAMRFKTVLRPTFALADVAGEIITGARSLQGRFPALTDAVIADAERSLAKVLAARGQKVASAVVRADAADDQQLALDVLLDCVDHLRAAARSVLSKSRPKLCQTLCAPIAPSATRAAAPVSDPVDGDPAAPGRDTPKPA